jgi:hypothetical protein
MSKPTNKKARTERIQGVTPGIVSQITVTYDPSDRTIGIHELDRDSLTVSRSYNRDSGKEKVTTAIKSSRENLSFDIWPELKASYDYLLAIDTNTSERAGLRVSVTIAYVVPSRLRTVKSEIRFVPLCGYVAVNVRQSINPEALGWHLILKNHLGRTLRQKARVGAIVDSELDRLPAINSRAIPYYSGHYLPQNVTLVYASDATADELPNQMIRYCDKAATAAMAKIFEDAQQLKALRSDDPNCVGYAWLQTKRA